jgi:hypothetical protein
MICHLDDCRRSSTGDREGGPVGGPAVVFSAEAVGYLTCRSLVRTAVNASVAVAAAVVGAIGGAAVTGLFATSVFAWYSIGLLAGMAVFFAVFGRLNGRHRLAAVLGVRTEVPSISRSSEPGPAAAQPDAGEVS